MSANPQLNRPSVPPLPKPKKTKTRGQASLVAPSRSRATVPAGRSALPKGRGRRPIRQELSAGGVVARLEDGQYFVALLQTEHRRGLVWVLPKGHVELHVGEKVSDAARREVEEEAGVRDLSVKDQLGVTRFSFQAEGALVRKTVHYFLMTTQQKALTPQAEEGIVAAQWFPIDEAIAALAYDTDQDIVARAKEKLTGMKTPLPRKKPDSRGHSPRVHT